MTAATTRSSSTTSSSLVIMFLMIVLIVHVVGTKAAATTATTTEKPQEDMVYDKDNNNRDDGFSKLVSWMESHGGRVDKRMTVAMIPSLNQQETKSSIDDNDDDNDHHHQIDSDHGSNTTNNKTMIRGVMALEAIAEGTELLFCPWKLVIGSTSLEQQMQSSEMCHVVEALRAEYELGSDSLWWPYLNHIRIPRLVAMWDTEAVKELQGLSPTNDATRHLDWMIQSCGKQPQHNDGASAGSEWDQHTMQALVSFITRASAVGMVPIYDLLNHHNGRRNAKLALTQDGVQLVVVGGGPIRRKEQIFLSYGVKSASTMMRDYGFVEDWPSIWSWTDAINGDNNVFVLFPDDIVAIQPSTDFLKEIWNNNGVSSLSKFQNSAIQHTTQTLSRETLVRFSTSARNVLDRLPTRLVEDAEILKEKKKYVLTQMGVGAAASVQAEDIVQAVQYRIAFKEAVMSAFKFAEAIVAKNDEEHSKQEL